VPKLVPRPGADAAGAMPISLDVGPAPDKTVGAGDPAAPISKKKGSEMRFKTVLFTMTALAMVSGCSRGANQANNSAGNATANVATANAAAAPAAPAAGNASGSAAAPVSTGPVDQAFLVGRWGVNGDCAQTMEFKDDGTVGPPEGSTYTISGSTVTVNSPGQAPDPKTVTRTGDDAMTVSGGGSSMNMTRCH
jgi:hypothetical protein